MLVWIDLCYVLMVLWEYICSSGCTLYGLAVAGAMGTIDLNLVQCLVFSALIVAVDPVAVSAEYS